MNSVDMHGESPGACQHLNALRSSESGLIFTLFLKDLVLVRRKITRFWKNHEAINNVSLNILKLIKLKVLWIFGRLQDATFYILMVWIELEVLDA